MKELGNKVKNFLKKIIPESKFRTTKINIKNRNAKK